MRREADEEEKDKQGESGKKKQKQTGWPDLNRSKRKLQMSPQQTAADDHSHRTVSPWMSLMVTLGLWVYTSRHASIQNASRQQTMPATDVTTDGDASTRAYVHSRCKKRHQCAGTFLTVLVLISFLMHIVPGCTALASSIQVWTVRTLIQQDLCPERNETKETKCQVNLLILLSWSKIMSNKIQKQWNLW